MKLNQANSDKVTTKLFSGSFVPVIVVDSVVEFCYCFAAINIGFIYGQ